MRTWKCIKGGTILGAVLALLMLGALNGCATGGTSSTPATQPTAQQTRLGAIVEVREAYATAENVVTSLVQAKAISVTTAARVRDAFKTGRSLIEVADASITAFDDGQWSIAIAAAWNALDQAVAIYSPAAPKPSAARKS